MHRRMVVANLMRLPANQVWYQISEHIKPDQVDLHMVGTADMVVAEATAAMVAHRMVPHRTADMSVEVMVAAPTADTLLRKINHNTAVARSMVPGKPVK